MTFGKIRDLLKITFSEWREDNAARLGAALAYYAVFSMAPLLVVVMSISGLVFGHDAAQGRVVEQLQGLVGRDVARSIESMIVNARSPGLSVPAAIAGTLVMLLGASGVFAELQDALNLIWNAPRRPSSSILQTIRERFLSFTMVLGTGFLLLVSLVISAAVEALNDKLSSLVGLPASVLQIIQSIVSFAVITIMFAMIFKILPRVRIAWSDVWIGAAVTSLLFTLGKYLIGLYLGRSSTASSYGAAGSIVIVLLWVYYSAQILFFGAEFTQAYANNYGSRLSFFEEQTSDANQRKASAPSSDSGSGRSVGPSGRPHLRAVK